MLKQLYSVAKTITIYVHAHVCVCLCVYLSVYVGTIHVLEPTEVRIDS